MGLLLVDDNLYRTEMMYMAKKFLIDQCDAEISKPVKVGRTWKIFVEGIGVPKGDRVFSLRIEQLVPQVFAISIVL